MNNVSGSNTTWESPPDMTAEYSQPSDGDSGKQVGRIAGLVTGIMVILLFVCVCLDRRRNQKKRRGRLSNRQEEESRVPPPRQPRDPTPIPPTGYPIGLSQSIFSYEELAIATNRFSKNNIIGEGGFGHVLKGVLPNEKVVAVKQLKFESEQGEREFRAEVEVISRIHHKHLVSLVGYCISGEQRLIVYEFVPNGNLEYHLHRLESPTMNWPTRLKIAIGSAKGLAYLHEDCQPKIIHRDIKATNILLDSNFDAKVADFGLAKFSSDTKSYVSTTVKGTRGYLDPEYWRSQKLTDKADIFSFGVVLLELITGRVPKLETELLYEWAKPLVKQALENGDFHALIDPRLQNEYDPSEMRRMVACAAACVRNSASNRPKMSQIVRALEGNLSLEDLNGEIKPGDSGEFGSYGSKSYDTNQRNEDLKKYNKLLQEDDKEDTNEHSEPSTNCVSALQTAR